MVDIPFTSYLPHLDNIFLDAPLRCPTSHLFLLLYDASKSAFYLMTLGRNFLIWIFVPKFMAFTCPDGNFSLGLNSPLLFYCTKLI